MLSFPDPEDRDPEALLGSRSNGRGSRQYRFKWWHPVVVVLILFPYISIFALFGLVSEKDDNTTNNVSFLDLSLSFWWNVIVGWIVLYHRSHNCEH